MSGKEADASLAPNGNDSLAMSLLRFIPNGLCFMRMLLLPPVIWLLVHEEFALTLWMFALAAVSDGLDGFLAKRFGWMSQLGKILDPLADKILLVGVFVTLAFMGLVPMWLAVSAVARDLVITAGALSYYALYGFPHGQPTVISKLNTLCQVLFLLVIIAARALGERWDVAVTILGALVLITTVVSGLDYVITWSQKAVQAARERRTGSVGQ
jgi:cardiolipin synthase (CMP-forming)